MTGTISREALIARLMWSGGGVGFGLCEVAGMALWDSQRPTKENPDWISIVTVQGKAEEYTDEELEKLVAFSDAQTAKYDALGFAYRMGANLIVLKKAEGGYWFRKRMSWTIGSFYSPSLDEALAVFKERE